jgi:hypothetical protein
VVGILPSVYDLRTNTSLFTVSPGRFLATNEIKALLAYIVTTYDIKFEGGQGVPRGSSIALVRTPASANVMFRKRQK